MPTLQPQTVSGLVVIPTIDLVGSVHQVSLAIDTGSSRVGGGAPAPDVVNREDLVVELRAPTEGSLEAIQSPDPGPLPVRALRVVQARGLFSFSQGVNAPNELHVTLRGDHKVFPMAQTFAPSGGCLSRMPREKGPFPVSGIRLPLIQPLVNVFRRGRCRPRRFEAPLNSSANAAAKSEYFEVEADFGASGKAIRCKCCEYRQFVRGTFTDANGQAVRFDLPSGPLDPSRYCEDGEINEFGPGAHGYYGRRASSTPGDEYSGTGTSAGCTYRADETASCPPTDTAHLEYVGMIVDRCQKSVVATKSWTIDL
jgi:hypothetical protein